MSYSVLAKASHFHGIVEAELAHMPARIIETKETKYFIVQDRELHYRFYLHQHPMFSN